MSTHSLPESVSITCSAPVNIAVIKYWGKRDEVLNLPLNSSLSGTLNQDDMKTVTTVTASKKFTEDELWLNGKKENIKNERIQKVFREIRSRAGDYKDAHGNTLIPKSEWANYHVHIVSTNNFPTAAGLASSASGYCCLVYAMAQLYHVTGDISTIARQGSGSACRSLFGGWVAWEVGTAADGSDSCAVQVKDEKHWPEIEVLILVANDARKETPSTDGMQQSVKTSKMMQVRASEIVPKRMKEMETAIANRDFQTFADLTMKDSDSFHDVCADTNPPIYYLNETSRNVIKMIRAYNEYSKTMKAAYTFDAGPNAVIYLPKEHIPQVLALALHYFPPGKVPLDSFVKDPVILKAAQEWKIPEDLLAAVNLTPSSDSLKYILHTTIGPGPKILNSTNNRTS